jgi:hypothetical protein
VYGFWKKGVGSMDKREMKYRAKIGGWSAIVTFLSDDETSRIIEKDIIDGTKKGYELEFEIERVPFESKLTKGQKQIV